MWRLWHRDRARRLSFDLNEFVMERFHLTDEQTASLRYLSKPGHHLNRPVSLIRIFAPKAIPSAPIPATYDELDAHLPSVWFQGYMTRSGAIYMADRRPMKGIRRRALRVLDAATASSKEQTQSGGAAKTDSVAVASR